MLSVMPSHNELRDLASLKLEEAEALFVAGKYDGCVYLCGYVVELGVKAIVCKNLAVPNYPKLAGFKVHDLDTLVLLAGLQSEVDGLSGRLRRHWSFPPGTAPSGICRATAIIGSQRSSGWMRCEIHRTER
jgi:hypothetical protein